MQFIKIDKDFQNLLRPLTEEEYKSLEDSIKQDGCLRPIELWNGYIADGHNRYSICMKDDIPFEQVDVTEKFETKSDVMKWIVQNQRARQTGRQLSKTELVAMADAIKEQTDKEAREAQSNAGKEFGRGSEKVTANLPQAKRNPTSAEKAAAAIGVSRHTYEDMKLVTEKGSEEQIERMNKGGRGNAPSAIAKEIRNPKIAEVRKCKICGQILPIKNFGMTRATRRYICKDCRNKRDKKQRIETRLKGTEGFYVDSVEEKIWSAEDVSEQLKRDFDSYIDGLKLELDVHKKEIESNKEVIDETIDIFANTLMLMKGAYR